MPDIATRTAGPEDESFLREMLYLALFVAPGQPLFPRSILDSPKISHYVQAFGRTGDRGIIAMDAHGDPIGAAWVRLLPEDDAGYGFVDRDTPELTIAIASSHRGRGVGTTLMRALLASIVDLFPAVSLSVDAANPARRLYERFGFEPVAGRHEDESSITMVKRLASWH